MADPINDPASHIRFGREAEVTSVGGSAKAASLAAQILASTGPVSTIFPQVLAATAIGGVAGGALGAAVAGMSAAAALGMGGKSPQR